MTDTLKWRVRGQVFEDESTLSNWAKIESSPWQWQFDNHELAFDIYEYAGQYWKLYRARWVPEGTTEYAYGYGGQACRMSQVESKKRARSPHSGLLKEAGDLEWVRTYEVDEDLHRVVRAGKAEPNYEEGLW